MNLKMEVNGVEFEIEPTDEVLEAGEHVTGIRDSARTLANRAFDDVVAVVSAIAESAGTRLRQVAEGAKPDEVTMSFTVGVKAGAGIVIKSVEASGTFSVQLKWSAAK